MRVDSITPRSQLVSTRSSSICVRAPLRCACCATTFALSGAMPFQHRAAAALLLLPYVCVPAGLLQSRPQYAHRSTALTAAVQQPPGSSAKGMLPPAPPLTLQTLPTTHAPLPLLLPVASTAVGTISSSSSCKAAAVHHAALPLMAPTGRHPVGHVQGPGRHWMAAGHPPVTWLLPSLLH